MASNSPWHHLYNTSAWKRRRAKQLAIEPLCRMCEREHRLTSATVADHITPHQGDWALFIGGELQSLCEQHHNMKTARGIEAGAAKTTKPMKGCDTNGIPTGEEHHWNG